MPFDSKAQSRAAFGGYLGKEMQRKAEHWAAETNYRSLPEKKAAPKKKNKKKYYGEK